VLGPVSGVAVKPPQVCSYVLTPDAKILVRDVSFRDRSPPLLTILYRTLRI
jgi:hypothetical protein